MIAQWAGDVVISFAFHLESGTLKLHISLRVLQLRMALRASHISRPLNIFTNLQYFDRHVIPRRVWVRLSSRSLNQRNSDHPVLLEKDLAEILLAWS